MIDNAHALKRLCDDASDNTLEEEGIFIIKDVQARRKEEVEV